MSHIVDFFTARFGSNATIVVGIIFFAMMILGFIIAVKGRQVMQVLVAVCGAVIGIFFGAAFGLLVFNSFIIMLITAFLGGALLLMLVLLVKGIGTFISMGFLGFFIAFTVTSEMYISSTRITEGTLVFIDLIAGVLTGILAAVQSKYTVSFITAAAGGMITSISVLVLLGYYFSDWKTWLLASVVAVFGMSVQFKTHDSKMPSKKKRSNGKHSKK